MEEAPFPFFKEESMKKFSIISLVVVVFLLCGFLYAAPDVPEQKYRVLVLGDIHYDGEAYHASDPEKSYQKNERIRNFDMWKFASSDLLATAAKQLDKDTLFVVQLGDFIQGDCDTAELQEKMFRDGFAKVKSFFPGHKLLAVKGNHDIRLLKKNDDGPAKRVFLPLIAEQMGQPELKNGNYAIRHGKDLYIGFDGFVPGGVEFVKKTLADNPDVRYVFFMTHLPVLPCSKGNPAWLIPSYSEIADLLASRRAIILTAHTHVISFMGRDNPSGKLTQLVTTSIGCNWTPDKKPKAAISGWDAFYKEIPERVRNTPAQKAALESMRDSSIRFEQFTPQSGFLVLDIDDNRVEAKIYTDKSGNPSILKVLRENKR